MDKELYAALKKANRKIEVLERYLESDSSKIKNKAVTERMIDALKDKASQLTNVSSGNLRIGGLLPEDRDRYLNILNNFNDSPMSSLSGQKEYIKQSKQRFEETYSDGTPLSDEDYDNLVSIFESDTFQKFKEKYGSYSNVINEMAANPKSYRRAVSMISGVNRATSKYNNADGSLNVKAFIDRWRSIE